MKYLARLNLLCHNRDTKAKLWKSKAGRVENSPSHKLRIPEKRKTAGPFPCRIRCETGSRYLLRLTAFLSSAPAENFATLRAAILMVAPVCGLRPLRAFLCETEEVPKPINATRSPFFRADVMLSTVVSIAVAACALLMPLPDAIRSMRSALFIVSPGRSLCPQRARGGSTP